MSVLNSVTETKTQPLRGTGGKKKKKRMAKVSGIHQRTVTVCTKCLADQHFHPVKPPARLKSSCTKSWQWAPSQISIFISCQFETCRAAAIV